MSGIYFHIPFCKQACHYCDFHFSTSDKYKEKMVASLLKEIAFQKDYLTDKNISTIYFGGGTPSILSAKEIESLINTTAKHFNIASDVEISLEANPDDLSEEKTIAFSNIGINRLSIGTQTFNEKLLTFLHRAHTSNEALKSIEFAKKHFQNISIDLIYGIHNQSMEIFKNDLYQLLQFEPEHVSAYSLTIEGNNAFAKWKAKGILQEEDDDLAIAHFQYLLSTLEEKGYEQYEISNFCKPGKESKHNSSYWFGVPYLGIGPSAHSFNGVNRQYNIAHNMKYMAAIENGTLDFETDILTQADKVNEYIMTRLRTKRGCNIKELETKLDYTLNHEQKQTINTYCASNDLSLNNHVLTLTATGKLIADKIASDLFIL